MPSASHHRTTLARSSAVRLPSDSMICLRDDVPIEKPFPKMAKAKWDRTEGSAVLRLPKTFCTQHKKKQGASTVRCKQIWFWRHSYPRGFSCGTPKREQCSRCVISALKDKTRRRSAVSLSFSSSRRALSRRCTSFASRIICFFCFHGRSTKNVCLMFAQDARKRKLYALRVVH